MTPSPGIESGPHWWEAIVFNDTLVDYLGDFQELTALR